MKPERIMGLAALFMAIGMGIGALGSHALATVLTAHQLGSLDTAVDYQLLNALGLFLVGLLSRAGEPGRYRLVALMLAAGIICFSGGIYAMLAGAPPFLGIMTPLGGILLIAAWLLLAWRLLGRFNQRPVS
jgi:uncharacterized membrane protein YgdD (TMEM256/DUF423 family)